MAAASTGFASIAIRLWREGDITNAISFAGGATLFVLYALLAIVFGRRSKGRKAVPSSWTISPKRFGQRVEITASSNPVAVELAQAKLRAAGIDTSVVGKHDTGVLPVLGEEAKLRLVVDPSDAERAAELLEETAGAVSGPAPEGHKARRRVVENGEDHQQED